jgi:hypothetical protein
MIHTRVASPAGKTYGQYPCDGLERKPMRRTNIRSIRNPART